jgi:GT2 family glycosyltransferase
MTHDVPMTLSVVIVSYNTRELTLRCLGDLCADLGGLSAEVFVVDNGSADGSVPAVRGAFPSVTVIDVGRNVGFGAANNMALRQATGEYALLLNTDAFVQPGAVAALVSYLGGHPRTAVVGPRLLNADGSLQRSCYKFPGPARALCENTLLTAALPNHPQLGDYRAWNHDAEREVGFVIGACMLVRRSAIEQVGLLDEQFFMYSEETDWCRRFRDAGWATAFTPAATVVHLNGSSGKQQADRVFNEFNRSAERYIFKHHGTSGLVVFRACMIVGSCIRIVLFGLRALVPGRGAEAWRRVWEWGRILAWHLGARGEGLRPRVPA